MLLPAARRFRTALAACALTLATGLVPSARAVAQEGAAAAQDVTLTDVVVPLGSTVLKFPKLTASGTRLSRDDLAALFRADSSEPWSTRLARLDAASLTAPVYVAERAGPDGMRQIETYRDVVARDVHAGKIGELTAAGATVSFTKAGTTDAGAGTYGPIRATDTDLTALAKLASEPGDGKGALLRIYGTLQMSDLVFALKQEGTLNIARVEVRDIAARQIPKGWDGALTATANGMDEPAARRGAFAAVADLLEAQSIGSLDVQGLSVSDSSSGKPLLTKVERVSYRMSGPDAGAAVEGLSVAGAQVPARIGRLKLAGGSLGPVVALLRRMARDPDGAVDAYEARSLAAAFGTFTLSDLEVGLPQDPPVQKRGALETPRRREAMAGDKPVGGVKTADPLAIAPGPSAGIRLREAVFAPGPVADGVPASTRLTLSGLDLPASVVSSLPLIGALPSYGYGNLSLDLAADAAWDEKARTVALKEVTVSGADIGRVTLAGQFGGIGPELFSGSVPAQTMLMFSGNARALDLTIENGGLFERFLAAQAKELSLKPDELRKEYVTASVLGVPVILGNGPAAKTIGAAMGQFVMNPGRLTIHAKSKEPTGVGFVELGTARSPASVLDRLDVEAKAN